MAPPCYGDLGKKANDLHSKGYHPGAMKFDFKSKTESGIELGANGQTSLDSGKMSGGCELTSKWPDYGMKYVEKWNTDNNLTVDFSIEDKILQGLKTSFISSFNPSSNKKKATLKTAYKHDRVNISSDVDFDYAGPILKGAVVATHKGFLAGYQMALNTPKKKLCASNFSLGYDAGDYVLNASLNNGQDFAGSCYHRRSDTLEGALNVGYSSANKATQVSAAVKYSASPDTALKMKASMAGEIGMSLQQKISKTLTLTLSGILDAKNIGSGGHRVGMTLEYE